MDTQNIQEYTKNSAPVPVASSDLEKDALEKFLNKSWRQIEITQDVSYGYDMDKVKALLKDWKSVSEYAAILHDKDKKEDFTPRAPHCHCLIKFNSPVPTRNILARLSEVGLGSVIPTNHLQHVKNWSGAVNYLTHRDEVDKPWKHVYDVSELYTNIDYELAASDAHSKKVFQITERRKKEIIDGICNGTICDYNLGSYLSEYEIIELDNILTKAFKLRAKKLMKEERSMEVIFVTGASGKGKDTFAVDFCRKKGLDYFRTNNNQAYPFDDYGGEPVVIWSDARDDVFKPSELFALLDNHWQSKQKARYRDTTLNCQYLIITSIKPLSSWYKSSFENSKEPRTQLYRRIKSYFVLDDNWLHIKVYNADTDDYDEVAKAPNIYQHVEDKLDTPEKRKQFAMDVLKGVMDLTSYAAEQVQAAPLSDFKKAPVDNPFSSGTQMTIEDIDWDNPDSDD